MEPTGQKKKKGKAAKKRELAARRASRVTCEICGNNKVTNMASHMDCNHVNEITFEISPGEWMTLSRSDQDGFFRCLWCVDREKPDRGRTRLRNAQDMQHHLDVCNAQRRGLMDSGDQPSPRADPPGPLDPRGVAFSTEVTVFPASEDEPARSEVITSSPTLASLSKLLECDEGLNPLDEEP